MKMFFMYTYGSQYHVNGPFVNVPVSLDQIVHHLPCMSNEMQLYPLKLKRKLVFKKHYLYHYIQKHVVMSCFKWLKNLLYKDIKLNNEWGG